MSPGYLAAGMIIVLYDHTLTYREEVRCIVLTVSPQILDPRSPHSQYFILSQFHYVWSSPFSLVKALFLFVCIALALDSTVAQIVTLLILELWRCMRTPVESLRNTFTSDVSSATITSSGSSI